MTTVSFRTSSQHSLQLERVAGQLGLSRSELARRVVEGYLNLLSNVPPEVSQYTAGCATCYKFFGEKDSAALAECMRAQHFVVPLR